MDRLLLEEAAIKPLVGRFYERVRADAELGPVFSEAVLDWDDHHARLADFWSSVMLATGRYKGNPVALHIRHSKALTPAAFNRWLSLWRETTEELLPLPVARAMQAKAERIAESLQLAIRHRRPVAA
jgi:hemoglobin